MEQRVVRKFELFGGAFSLFWQNEQSYGQSIGGRGRAHPPRVKSVYTKLAMFSDCRQTLPQVVKYMKLRLRSPVYVS